MLCTKTEETRNGEKKWCITPPAEQSRSLQAGVKKGYLSVHVCLCVVVFVYVLVGKGTACCQQQTQVRRVVLGGRCWLMTAAVRFLHREPPCPSQTCPFGTSSAATTKSKNGGRQGVEFSESSRLGLLVWQDFPSPAALTPLWALGLGEYDMCCAQKSTKVMGLKMAF